jgi:succinoglycan biosynthesis transport protein ExoP
MLDTNDFSFFEGKSTFDFKSFLIKILSYWKLFILSLLVAYTIAYQVNIRKEKIYGIESLINIKEENNPFFTSNTSLVFNWGGTSDKVQTIQTILKSRSHNELVVARMHYYIDYLKQGKYHFQDAYGEAPFKVDINVKKGQLLGKEIQIHFLNATDYEIEISFEEQSVPLYHYSTNSTSTTPVVVGSFKKKYKIGEQVNLPFLDWKLELNEISNTYIGSTYYVRFNDFNNVVSSYRTIDIEADAKSGSLLKLKMQGTNKARLVDFLNTTVTVLRKNELDSKNQFANNTIRFIDSTLVAMEKQLRLTEGELQSFRKNKNVFELEGDGSLVTGKLSNYDIERDLINRKLAYYNRLNSYLINSTDYSKLPAPAVAGIEDPNVVSSVSKLIALSTERSAMAYTVKNDKVYRDFDNQMEAVKQVLLQNIASAKEAIQYDLSLVSRNINKAEASILQLPEEQQALLKIKRKYDLNDNIYNTFLQKRSEANIVKAANVSDIQFIDPAKDVGGGLLGPKTSINYILATFLGLLLPLCLAFGLTFFDTSVHSINDIAQITSIPIIGTIGVNNSGTNLVVYDKPKSAIAESFRSVRSALQFLYKNKNVIGSKTLMVTSSISGEGKSFCATNIASVFALSEKKTVIVGMDLRKPKIVEDFNLPNTYGVVNYLIGQKDTAEIIQKTHIPFLDVIASGPIPPNPSELILGEKMKMLLDELKSQYDYIILDTPPIGLVSDALGFAAFCDATIFVVRQNVTKKDMVSLIKDKNKSKELQNVSLVLNGFANKAKHGYGYKDYSYGYYEEDDSSIGIIERVKRFFISKV